MIVVYMNEKMTRSEEKLTKGPPSFSLLDVESPHPHPTCEPAIAPSAVVLAQSHCTQCQCSGLLGKGLVVLVVVVVVWDDVLAHTPRGKAMATVQVGVGMVVSCIGLVTQVVPHQGAR
jgi:hypothetical protein